MPIKILNPQFVAPPIAPTKHKVRCQSDVQENSDYGVEWRKSVFKNKARRYAASERVMQCTFNAMVEINGVPLCRRHAGFLVLGMWISGELIEKPKNPMAGHPDGCECAICWQHMESGGPGII